MIFFEEEMKIAFISFLTQIKTFISFLKNIHEKFNNNLGIPNIFLKNITSQKI